MNTVMREGVTDMPGAAFVDVVFHDEDGTAVLSEVWKQTAQGMVKLYGNPETAERHLVYDPAGRLPAPYLWEIQA